MAARLPERRSTPKIASTKKPSGDTSLPKPGKSAKASKRQSPPPAPSKDADNSPQPGQDTGDSTAVTAGAAATVEQPIRRRNDARIQLRNALAQHTRSTPLRIQTPMPTESGLGDASKNDAFKQTRASDLSKPRMSGIASFRAWWPSRLNNDRTALCPRPTGSHRARIARAASNSPPPFRAYDRRRLLVAPIPIAAGWSIVFLLGLTVST